MLGTLLDKLQGLFSKYFVIGSFFPVLIFAFANTVTLYLVWEPAHRWINGYYGLSPSLQGVYGFTVLIGLSVLAYVYSTMNLYLREVLEGQHLPPRCKRWMISIQMSRLDDLQGRLSNSRRERRKIRCSSQLWEQQLYEAREHGKTHETTCDYDDEQKAGQTIDTLQNQRSGGGPIRAEDLEQAVTLLGVELSNNNAELRSSEKARSLDRRHRDLLMLIDQARTKADSAYSQSYNAIEFNYSHDELAPTQMGNIAESARYYAQSRYALNLDFFWNRLQRVLQTDQSFFTTLQDAKTQLDFMVGLFWATALYTALWLVLLPFMARSYLPLIGVWLFGPLLLWLWYEISLQNYRAFADLLRTSIDLHRFDLLTLLHFALPPDSQAERELWDALNRQKCYGESDVSTAYKHP